MTRLRILPAAVAWMPWGADAFRRAREERKPILLSIVAEWCEPSREMDRTTYAQHDTIAAVMERFVPVRVDADQRPDIAERYTLGGWPTTAFLNEAGAIVGGGTYLSPGQMPAVLARVSDAFARRGDEIARAAAAPGKVETAAPGIDDATLAERVLQSFNPGDGSFGEGARFPLDAPIRLAVSLWQGTGDERYERVAITALDAMGWGPLYDDIGGGFFRCAARPGWLEPRTEKLLQVNAALLRLYADVGFDLDVARYRERAADILRYVQTWLADPVDGGWAAAQAASDTFYPADVTARHGLAPPAVSRFFFADGNGRMAAAALRAARLFGDEGLRDFALKSLERVLLACYRPGDGVAHFHDGERRVPGLLADQVAMADACLEAHETTGSPPYEMMAEELMHAAARTMWNEQEGGFFDRAGDPAHDVGLLGQRLTPFVGNCEAAEVLARLGRASGDHEFSRLASDTLRAMAAPAASQGPLAAHYLLALRAAAVR